MPKIRVRARAVDMLGRQQIAGIPTAIHELFKNSHDAYATRVEVDFYRLDGTFVLRDDGYGMTRSEFEDRWLTIGTESKVGANRQLAPTYLDPNTPRRVILGEKGIGRLAIATIGRQVLILTRAKRHGELDDLVVSFVHWGLFEIPGIDLDSIVIPVDTLPGGTLPNRGVVTRLTKQIADNVRALEGRLSAREAKSIIQELTAFSIDPESLDVNPSELSLRGDGRGTHFYVMPTDPILESDIDEVSLDDVAGPLQKMLLGFSNTMMPNNPSPVIETAFRDHKRDGRTIDLISKQEFFTPNEFRSADHHFEGVIDEYGEAKGTLSIYGTEPDEFRFEFPEGYGKKTLCGPFSVRFVYVQGLKSDSLLPPEEFARTSAKLNRIGGLYIYRDGIRILPYGNSDYDFLNIERRRTKSAQDWFFSFRRIFGAIELTSEFNGNLKEKAGREGFIANAAYRQLRQIMENLFMQLAKTFFRKDADRAGEYNRIKLDLQHQASVLQRREKRVAERKGQFQQSLGKFFNAVQSGEPEESADELKQKLSLRLDAIRDLEDGELSQKELLTLETYAARHIRSLRGKFSVGKARGFSVSKKVRASWYAYQDEVQKLEKELFTPLEEWVDKRITHMAGMEGIALERRRRANRAISELQERSLRTTRSAGAAALKEAKELVEVVRKDAYERLATVSENIQNNVAEFSKLDLDTLGDDELKQEQEEFQNRMLSTVENEAERLEAVLSQLHSMTEALAAGDLLSDEEEALEAEYVGAKEQLELFTELAQVGTALGIIQHEFGTTIRSVRQNIQRLAEWAPLDAELSDIYSDIRASFEHLDGYLTLFTPLNRRLQRNVVPIRGEEIRRYLQHVFGERLQRHAILLSATQQFDQKSIMAYPSTYYPTFINLVDNAIYWIATKPGGERAILLDADDQGFTVTNSGPGIPIAIKDWIFGFANTEKDGGRGMGLYIAKHSLVKDGADIELENAGKDNDPTFRIVFPRADLEEML